MSASTKLLMWGVIILLLLPGYNFYLNGILQYRFGMPSISAVSYILMALIGAWSYLMLNGKGRQKPLTIILLLFLGTMLSYFLYPDIRDALLAKGYNPLDSQAVVLFLYCVPAMIVASRLPSWEKAFDIMAKFSMAVVPIGIFSYWVQIQALGVLELDYMSVSSFLVLPVCTLCSYGYVHRKWSPFLIALVGITYIFVVGSRGAFLCSMVSLLFCLYRMFRHSGTVYKIGMAVVIAVAVAYFGQSFIQSSESAAESGFGRGRTLNKIEEGSFFVSMGREEINKVVDAGIWENPLGYGLFGDRHVMVKGGLPPTYCHSIIREFLCDFGVIIGVILLFYLVYMLYKTQKKIKDPYAYEALVIVTIAGLVHLLASGTYLTDIMFWAMIGLMMNPYIQHPNSLMKK